MGLAAVFGGLRVQTELEQAANYRDTASQVTVLRPAVAYLAAAEHAAVVAREGTAAEDPGPRHRRGGGRRRRRRAREGPRHRRPDAEPSASSRRGARPECAAAHRHDGYLSIGQSVSQVRQLHRGVTALINTIVAEQIEPEPRLQILVADAGRPPLAGHAAARRGLRHRRPRPTASAGRRDRRRVRRHRAPRSRARRHRPDGAGPAPAERAPLRHHPRERHRPAATRRPTPATTSSATDLLNGIDTELAQRRHRVPQPGPGELRGHRAAPCWPRSSWRSWSPACCSNPIRRVREGALHVAREELPEEVARIRAGEDPGEITPIDVTSREEIGQLARAVDDLHRQARPPGVRRGQAALARSATCSSPCRAATRRWSTSSSA